MKRRHRASDTVTLIALGAYVASVAALAIVRPGQTVQGVVNIGAAALLAFASLFSTADQTIARVRRRGSSSEDLAEREIDLSLAIAAKKIGLTRARDGWLAPGRQLLTSLGDDLVLRGLPPLLAFARREKPVEDPEGTGDRAFDGQILVGGPAREVAGRLDADARKKIRALTALLPTLRLEEGTMRAKIPPEFRERHGLESVVRGFLGILDATASAPDDARLLVIAATDPVPAVRRAALATLLEEATDPELRTKAIDAGFADASAEVKVAAALAAGPRGHDLVAQIALDEQAPFRAREEAIRGARTLPRERARDVLLHCLRGHHVAAQIAAATAAEALRWPELLAGLNDALRTSHPPVSVAVARALGAIGDPAGEDPLLRLTTAGDADVRAAAVDALGLCGTPRSILRLKELEAGLFAGDLGRRAADAIARIQGRLVGADEGQLAFAEQGGELSEPSAERGAVSLARQKT